MPERSLQYVNVEKLPPHPRNPKGHVLPEIEASMDRWGYTAPFVLDERTGLIAEGHGRREALLAKRERGDPAPDGVRVNDAGEWLVPVIRGWESKDDAELEAYLVGSNRLTMIGGWADDALLREILEQTSELDVGLVGTGFNLDDLTDLKFILDGVTAGQSPAERLVAFETRGVRTIVLPLSVEEHSHALAWLEALRKRYEVETNSAVVLRLLEEACKSSS